MYKLKYTSSQFTFLLKAKRLKRKDIAEKIGVSEGYISQIKKGKCISKLCAYAVCKAIAPDLEIEDLFVKN